MEQTGGPPIDYAAVINRMAQSARITMPVQDTIDRLWTIAQAVALENADQYDTVRNAIAWLEVLRNG